MPEASQTELAIETQQAFVCPYCSAVLPAYHPDSYSWEHCDPRPPRGGISLEDLGPDTNHE